MVRARVIRISKIVAVVTAASIIRWWALSDEEYAARLGLYVLALLAWPKDS